MIEHLRHINDDAIARHNGVISYLVGWIVALVLVWFNEANATVFENGLLVARLDLMVANFLFPRKGYASD